MRKLFSFLLVLVIAFSFIPNVNAQSVQVQSDTLNWGYKFLGKTMVTAYNITGANITKKSIVALDTSQFFLLDGTLKAELNAVTQTVDSFTTRIDRHEGNPWQLVIEFQAAEDEDTLFISGTVFSTRSLITGERDSNQKITVVDTVHGTDASTISSYHWYGVDSISANIKTSTSVSVLGAPIFALAATTVDSLAVGVISSAVADSGLVNLTLFGHLGEGTLDGETTSILRGRWLKVGAGNDFLPINASTTFHDSLAVAQSGYYSNGNDQYGMIIIR